MSELKTAVIIAGGEGSRLKPLTDDKPKSLVEISGKPILYWIIKWLKVYGIKHLVIGVAYKKEKIFEFMKKHDNFGLKVDFSEHTVDGGTAQGFKRALRFVDDENFLAMNGDELTNMDISKMWKEHLAHKPVVTMALAPFHCRFSVVKLEGNKIIAGFQYGHKLKDTPVSIGVYIFNHKIKEVIPETGSIEDLVFAKLANERKMEAYSLDTCEEWESINTIKDIKEAEEKIKVWKIY